MQHIRALMCCTGLTQLVWANLTVNLAKCDFTRATVTYLGKVVGQGQVRLVEPKLIAVQEFPAPANKKELMWFLRLVSARIFHLRLHL